MNSKPDVDSESKQELYWVIAGNEEEALSIEPNEWYHDDHDAMADLAGTSPYDHLQLFRIKCSVEEYPNSIYKDEFIEKAIGVDVDDIDEAFFDFLYSELDFEYWWSTEGRKRWGIDMSGAMNALKEMTND